MEICKITQSSTFKILLSSKFPRFLDLLFYHYLPKYHHFHSKQQYLTFSSYYSFLWSYLILLFPVWSFFLLFAVIKGDHYLVFYLDQFKTLLLFYLITLMGCVFYLFLSPQNFSNFCLRKWSCIFEFLAMINFQKISHLLQNLRIL